MASIIISSFSMISVKDNDLLMPVLGSWVKNETGSVIICWGSGMVDTSELGLLVSDTFHVYRCSQSWCHCS